MAPRRPEASKLATLAKRVVALSIPFAANDTPPSEFLIFKPGVNTTVNGDWLFDDQAARDVMAAYAAHGIDVMIDLEHLSIDEEANNYDPDARGWCKLEMRNGELWAVGVTWTPDGEARLREKRQRYISPTFAYDKSTGRVAYVHNIAITAIPATDQLPPLVAASAAAGQGDNTVMTPEQFAALAEALGLGADANVEDVLATVAAMVKKIQDAANGNAAPADDAPPPADAPAPMVATARVYVAARELARLTGKGDIAASLTDIKIWRDSHLALEANRESLKALEASERRGLVAELVKLGRETPATAWSDDKGTVPAEPWASMKIEALRDRVAKLSGQKMPKPAAPPAAGGGGASEDGGKSVDVDGTLVQLSAREVRMAGTKLEAYARNKKIHEEARAKAPASRA